MHRENTTKRAAIQSAAKPPGAPKTHTGTKTHKRAAASAQTKIDYGLTSQKSIVRKKAPPPVEIRLKRFLTGKTLKTWRKAHGYSAHALAVALGVSRSYIKSIEGGSLPASQKLIARFDALREKLGEGSAPTPETETARRVVSRHKLPASFEILARPVKCKTCHAYFIGRTPQQKFCGERCATLGRKAQRKRATRSHAKEKSSGKFAA